MVLVVITLIKEAIIGILIALAIVSFALFLDHHFLLKFPTARRLRRATMSLMNDRETMINMEESSGLKFIDMNEYNSKVKEIDIVTKKIALGESMFERAVADIKSMDAEREQYVQEKSKLTASLDLDRFCHMCLWSKSQQITCASRVKALQRTYDTPRHTAMMSAMKKESCRKSDEDMEKRARQEKRKKTKEAELMEHWAEKKKDFCAECEWEEGKTCVERVNFLNERYLIPRERAKATAMVESNECKFSHQKKAHGPQEEKLANFCPQCQWGPHLTCQQRVEYLMYTYKVTQRKAKLDAIQKPTCVKGRA